MMTSESGLLFWGHPVYATCMHAMIDASRVYKGVLLTGPGSVWFGMVDGFLSAFTGSYANANANEISFNETKLTDRCVCRGRGRRES